MDQPPQSTPSLTQKGLTRKDWIIGLGVAIACIAGFTVFGGWTMKKNTQPRIRATMASLVIAIKSYQTEYNRFPLPKGQVAVDSVTIVSSGPFLDSLLNEASDINPRKVKFFDHPPARKGVNGLLEKDGKRMLVDSWGQPYAILLDFDGDGKVPDPEHPGAMLNTTVMVFSGGPDGNPATWQDNVTSWK